MGFWMAAIVIVGMVLLYSYFEERNKHQTKQLDNEERAELDHLRHEVTELRGRVENLEAILIEQERSSRWKDLETSGRA
ncbi:MAG: hypothetical protein ACLFV4_12170 [Candidatus Hydrogenedentota bacterium]